MRWERWQMNYWVAEGRKASRVNSAVVNQPRIANAKRAKAKRLEKHILSWEQSVVAASPKFSQAKVLIKKFGGIIPFSIALGVHPEIILEAWLDAPQQKRGKPTIPKTHRQKTDGLVPTQYLAQLIIAARVWGILLKPQDIYPEYVGEDGVKNLYVNEEINRWVQKLKPLKRMQKLEHEIASLLSTPE